MSVLGNRIKKEREDLGLSREDLAQKLGVSYSAIAMYEQGNREPNSELLLKMCEIFNCSIDYLIGKSNYKEKVLVDVPNLLNKYSNYIKNSNMPEIEYNILSLNEKNILQDMFDNLAKKINGDKNSYPISYFKNKVVNTKHWQIMLGIYLIYNKCIYDVFSELNSEFSNNYEKKIGIKFNKKEEINSNLFMIPIVGKITAGKPILAQENLEGYLPIDPTIYGITSADNLFFLRVSGNSMNQKVRNGDYALIHKQNYAENGDIVVAIVNGDDEATLKRYKKINKDLIALEPMSDDPSYETIYIDKNTKFQIIGKAIGQFGKF